jgi:hypothetical protein
MLMVGGVGVTGPGADGNQEEDLFMVALSGFTVRPSHCTV